MSSSIIPETVNDGLDLRFGANGSYLTDIERTPGAVAVMGSADVGLVDEAGPTTTPETAFPATNSPTIDGLNDKAAIKFHKIAESISRDPASKCGQSAVISHCEGEAKHGHGKVLLCGVDWCPTCGKYMSAAHKHRVAGKVKKIQQLQSMGYLDIEFIDTDRHNPRLVYSAAGILNTNAIIKDILAGKRGAGNKRQGGLFERGFNRWHWFGDRCLNQEFRGKKSTLCKLTGKPCPKSHTDCEDYKKRWQV